jgi:ATP-binding cassette subfamily F protein 3
MLKIENLSKAYGSQVLFEDVSLQMHSGERLALVGRNGHGKSTLFKMILGEDEWDAGEITLGKNYEVGHLAQHLKFDKPNILEEACLGLRGDEIHDHYKAEAILFGLGFEKSDLEKAPHLFSGGYQIRLNLAKVLLAKPNLLLLDEPTNYLDIVSIRWLTKYLTSWPGEMILISHDRDFLGAVSTHTACIHRQKIKKIEGSTAKAYEQILLEEEVHEKTRVNEQKKREQMDAFIDRFRAKASKATVVQSRIKMRDKLPNLEKLSNIQSLDFEFRYEKTPAKVLMEADDLTFAYPGGENLIENFSLHVEKNDRIAIIGKNGKGKSTLLNLLAGELQPVSGNMKSHGSMRLGYFGQTNINRLDEKATIEEEVYRENTNLSRTAVRGLCGAMMFSGDKAEKQISVLSGGEKSRVLLAKILAHPSNLLFLDEPTNHLDMESIEALTDSIDSYPGAVVLVTHSETLLRQLVNKLVIFHRGGIQVFEGSYDEFLEKIGWEEEEGKKPKKKKKSGQDGYKASKEFAKKERALKKEMETLESKITKLENEIKNEQHEMEQASHKNDIDTLLKLTTSVDAKQKEVDEYFEKLSQCEEKLSNLN